MIYEFDLLLLKVLLLLEQDHPFHLALGTSLQRYLKDDKQLAAQYHDAVQKSKVALCRYNNYGVFCGICICNKFFVPKLHLLLGSVNLVLEEQVTHLKALRGFHF